MSTPVSWKGWIRSEDLPDDIRRTIHQAALVPLLDPEEGSLLKRTVLDVFSEVLDDFMEEHELRWRCDHVHRARPNLPMEAVFQAVSVELGVSVVRLKTIWFTSRRKSRVKELVRQQLQKTP